MRTPKIVLMPLWYYRLVGWRPIPHADKGASVSSGGLTKKTNILCTVQLPNLPTCFPSETSASSIGSSQQLATSNF